MIKRALSALATSATYLCIATVMAQLVIVGVLWQKGALTEEKRIKLWAHLHGVDVLEIKQKEQVQLDSSVLTSDDQFSQSPMMNVRSDALGVGIDQVKHIESRISGERQRYDKIRDIFDSRLKELEKDKITASRATVQRTLEVIDPALAKDLILQILDEGGAEDATAIMVQMPADRQKKIFGEFVTPDEIRKMNEILMRLRSGQISQLATEPEGP